MTEKNEEHDTISTRNKKKIGKEQDQQELYQKIREHLDDDVRIDSRKVDETRAKERECKSPKSC